MLKLQPVLKNYLWGGRKLCEAFGRDNGGDVVSESWEFSVHPDGLSLPLADFLRNNARSVDNSGGDFPVLIKYIDAAQSLSVQVHPDDYYARKNEGDNGKTEAWYVVSAEKGAGIYCGFNRDVTKEEFLRSLSDGSVEKLLNFIPVKAGECYLIEAGMVHAIGAGCVIYEVQQSSNVTYRVYDYDRVGADGRKRQLHVDKAVDVINFAKYQDRTNTRRAVELDGGRLQTLTECKYFRLRKLVLNGEYCDKNDSSFTAVSVLSGRGEINGVSFAAGDSFFISRSEELIINGSAEIMLTDKSNQKYYAGIDLGGTFIKCGIVDDSGRLLRKDKVATTGEYRDVVRAMADIALSLAGDEGVALSGIGVGCPGTVDSSLGIILYSNNLAWKNLPIAMDIEVLTGVHVAIANDANAAALGEYAFGAGKSCRDMVLVTLGTGVGGGIIIDGKLFEGNKGAGAELGHVVIKHNGEKCTCGMKGCLETYASAGALVRQAREYMRKNTDTLLWELCGGDVDRVDGKMIFDAVHSGDKGAIRVLKKYTDYLSCGLVSIANVFRPEVIVLGGGISAAGELLTKPLKRNLSRFIYGGQRYAPVKLATATLENDAGVLGAAKLVMD